MKLKHDILLLGDSLEYMRRMPSKSVNVIITDPPYNTTSNDWDTEFDTDLFWKHAHRICTGAIVMTASQPFSSKMVMSNLQNFRHEWIWQKNAGSNFANTVREPFKEHESVLVFSVGKWTYNPQMQERADSGKSRVKTSIKFETGSDNYRQFDKVIVKQASELRVPSSVQKFNRERGLHPTQKPVDLMRYLIRTYTNESDLILDPFMGSGTTCLAAKLEKRRYIGIDKKKKYLRIATDRLTSIPNRMW